jgi:hypothetical protein
MTPHRVQLSRKAGWKKPGDTVVVARPTKWGNPFVPGKDGIPDRETAVRLFREATEAPGWTIGRMTAEIVRRELRGKNLACWCSLDGPCHADVLLKIANAD